MAAPNKVSVITASEIQWDSGAAFDGWALFLLAFPTVGGDPYVKAFLKGDEIHHVRLPIRQKWPIVNGALDTSLRIWRNDSITPPNTRYCIKFYDTTGTFVANGSSLVNINSGSSYTLVVPTLTVPTAPVVCPTPESQFVPGTTSGTASIAPSIVDLSGTKNDVNVTFTVPGGTIATMLLYWNGQYLEEGDGYTLSGSVVTMDAAPGSGDSLEAAVWYA